MGVATGMLTRHARQAEGRGGPTATLQAIAYRWCVRPGRIRIGLLLAILAAAAAQLVSALPGAAQGGVNPCQQAPTPGESEITLLSGGVERTAILYVPPAAAGQRLPAARRPARRRRQVLPVLLGLFGAGRLRGLHRGLPEPHRRGGRPHLLEHQRPPSRRRSRRRAVHLRPARLRREQPVRGHQPRVRGGGVQRRGHGRALGLRTQLPLRGVRLDRRRVQEPAAVPAYEPGLGRRGARHRRQRGALQRLPAGRGGRGAPVAVRPGASTTAATARRRSAASRRGSSATTGPTAPRARRSSTSRSSAATTSCREDCRPMPGRRAPSRPPGWCGASCASTNRPRRRRPASLLRR